MNVITATGQIWRQKYASPREGRFPSATAGRTQENLPDHHDRTGKRLNQ